MSWRQMVQVFLLQAEHFPAPIFLTNVCPHSRTGKSISLMKSPSQKGPRWNHTSCKLPRIRSPQCPRHSIPCRFDILYTLNKILSFQITIITFKLSLLLGYACVLPLSQNCYRNFTPARFFYIEGDIFRMRRKRLGEILNELDDEMIQQMPEWFKRLREAYRKRNLDY